MQRNTDREVKKKKNIRYRIVADCRDEFRDKEDDI